MLRPKGKERANSGQKAGETGIVSEDLPVDGVNVDEHHPVGSITNKETGIRWECCRG